MSWGLIEPYGGPQCEFLSNEDVVYFLSEPNFWIVMTITAVAGFLINIAIFLQIKVTTPLTNTISGTAKVCPGLHQGAHGRRADTRLKLCYTAHRRVWCTSPRAPVTHAKRQVNGALWDLNRPFETDARLDILDFNDTEGAIAQRLGAHALAH